VIHTTHSFDDHSSTDDWREREEFPQGAKARLSASSNVGAKAPTPEIHYVMPSSDGRYRLWRSAIKGIGRVKSGGMRTPRDRG